MQLERDYALEQQTYDRLRERYKKIREGIHVSDLVYCPRKFIYRRIDGSREITNKQVVFYILGEHKHMILQSLGWDYVEKEQIYEDIFSHVDIVDNIGYMEIKTTRRFKFITTAEEMPETWKRQILAYMYIHNITVMKLLIVYDIRAEIHVHTFKATKEEIEENWKELLRRKKLIEQVLKNPSDIDILPPPLKWECNNCEYKPVCDYYNKTKRKRRKKNES